MLKEVISNDYLRGIIISALLIIIFRAAYFSVERIIKKLSKKTRTDIDDIIIEKSSKPATFLVTIIALRIGIGQISLPENVDIVIMRIFYSLLAISISYVLYATSDILISSIINKKTKNSSDKKILRSVSSFVLGSVNIALIVITIIYVLHFWGVQIAPLLAGLGIAGLAVALALQPTLANIFSGISLILDKSISVGDLVYLDAETKGEIQTIGLRSTKIRTYDNELIIVPNTKLAESKIQNVALPEPKSRVIIPFSVAYGSEIERVKDIVLKEIKKLSDLEKEPSPIVRFTDMGESSINFKAYFYVNTFENRFKNIDQANTLIYNALRKNKIEIPFPQMDVHLKKD